MGTYRAIGSIMSQINGNTSMLGDSSKSEMSNVSTNFSKSQSEGNKNSSDVNTKSNSSFKDINNPGDPTIQANQQRSELTKQSGNISFKDQPSEDSDEGVLASSFRKAKEEAKLWMMGKLESGLSNLTDKDSASADTGTGVESSKANKKLGVGKIPVLGSNPQPLPTNMPNPSIPSTKIPQPSVPNMTMPRMTSPKMPKF